MTDDFHISRRGKRNTPERSFLQGKKKRTQNQKNSEGEKGSRVNQRGLDLC